jgi:hypothetical protein
MVFSNFGLGNSTALTDFCYAVIAPGECCCCSVLARSPCVTPARESDAVQRRILPLVFWSLCAALHLSVACLYIVALIRHSVGTANGLKCDPSPPPPPHTHSHSNTNRYWELQRPMFIVATCAAATGLASAACYLFFFASDSADVVFLKGLRGQVRPTLLLRTGCGFVCLTTL